MSNAAIWLPSMRTAEQWSHARFANTLAGHALVGLNYSAKTDIVSGT